MNQSFGMHVSCMSVLCTLQILFWPEVMSEMAAFIKTHKDVIIHCSSFVYERIIFSYFIISLATRYNCIAKFGCCQNAASVVV